MSQENELKNNNEKTPANINFINNQTIVNNETQIIIILKLIFI